MLTEVEINKGYHVGCSEVNVGAQCTADKKNREWRNVFEGTSEHGQLGHLQSDLLTMLYRFKTLFLFLWGLGCRPWRLNHL